MKFETINFEEKFDQINELWSPKIIAQMNDYHFKIAKIQGEFVWHTHQETDEVFIVISGEMQIEFRSSTSKLKTGEMIVVPKGIEHKPSAQDECQILMIEVEGTLNTGDTKHEMTIEEVDWIR